MTDILAGLFLDRGAVESAIVELQAVGVDPADITLISRDTAENEHIVQSTDATVVEPRGDEALSETSVEVSPEHGALLASQGALALPGIGPVVSIGFLATAFAQGVVSRLTGGLQPVGLPPGDLERYESGVREGKLLLTVTATAANVDMLRTVLKRAGGETL